MADLLWAFICRKADVKDDGDLDAYGILDRLSMDAFPTDLTPLVLVANWRADRAEALPARIRHYIDGTPIAQFELPLAPKTWRPRTGYWTAGMLFDVSSKAVEKPCQMDFEILEGNRRVGMVPLEVGYPLIGPVITIEHIR